MAAALFTLALALLYVRSRFLTVELSYDVAQRQEQKAALEEERRALTLELATLRNPKRVEKIAEKKFGLKRPSDMKQAVIVREVDREVP